VPEEKTFFGPDLITKAKVIVHHIQDNMKALKSCQESYANKRHRPLELDVGNHVYLCVSLMKGVKRFGMKDKLAPCYVGPFPMMKKCGPVAYKLDLLLSLASIHDVFNETQQKKCLKEPSDVDLSYSKRSIKVQDKKDRVTRRKTMKFFKVQWSNHFEKESTWETKDLLRSCHPKFLSPQ
jgi:hypothetical protein